MPGENIGPQAHANPDVAHNVEMVQNLLHLKKWIPIGCRTADVVTLDSNRRHGSDLTKRFRSCALYRSLGPWRSRLFVVWTCTGKIPVIAHLIFQNFRSAFPIQGQTIRWANTIHGRSISHFVDLFFNSGRIANWRRFFGAPWGIAQ